MGTFDSIKKEKFIKEFSLAVISDTDTTIKLVRDSGISEYKIIGCNSIREKIANLYLEYDKCEYKFEKKCYYERNKNFSKKTNEATNSCKQNEENLC
jgi:hypothetical protein